MPWNELTIAKLVLLASVVLLFVTHVLALIPAPWTSLEWTRGLALRYVLPLLLLYIALVGISLFPSGLLTRNASAFIGRSGSLVVMVLATLYYLDRNAVRDLPRAEWFPILDWRWVGCAAAIVVAYWARGRHHARWRWTAMGIGCAILLFTSLQIARDHYRLMAQAHRAEPSGACGGEVSVSENEYRCGYSRMLAFERQHSVGSGTRRVFVVSRFDSPLELQGPDLDTLVFDVRGRTELPGWLESHGPGRGPRDYLIIDAREKGSDKSQRLAYRLAAARGLEFLGVCGRYEISWARPL